MIIGKARIVKCPYCGAKKELMSLVSGNTLRAEYWSDNKMSAPMLPQVSIVQKCPKCGKYYLYYKQKEEYGEDESFERGSDLSYGEWKEAYHQFCQESTTLDKSDWANVRMGLIHAYNDLITGRNDYIPDDFRDMLLSRERPVDAFVASVIGDFVREYDWSKEKNPLLKAELCREAGQFDKSMETLQSIKREELDDYERGMYDDIKMRVEQKDIKVFRIKSVQERADDAMKKRWEKMAELERQWLEEQKKDPRLKVCKNGHCFKNTEHMCKWCGEKEVVERVEDDAPRTNVVLFVGQRNGQWVLTTDPDIEGKGEQIRKITVEIVGGHKLYYHLDGQNPNPFNNNSIKLDKKTTTGRWLTKKCDRLIDEKLGKVPLGISVTIPVNEDVD